METLHMNKQHLHQSQRWLLTLVVAATLALTLTLGQTAVGKLIGVDLTPTAYACQTNGGGC